MRRRMAQKWYFRAFTFPYDILKKFSLVKQAFIFCEHLLLKTSIEPPLVNFKMHFLGNRLNLPWCSQDYSPWGCYAYVENLTWFRQPLWLSKHKLIRGDYLSGSGKDLRGGTADQTKRPCSGSSVVFWQVPRVNSRYRTWETKECFWVLDFMLCFWFLKIRPHSE